MARNRDNASSVSRFVDDAQGDWRADPNSANVSEIHMTATDQISAYSFSINESQNDAIFDLPRPDGVETSLLLETVFEEACRWIERNYREPTLSPDEVARNARCSRATLYRAFQAHGLTVSGYIRHVRLEQVCARFSVAAPRIPISSIAFDCGFECLRHFNRSFKAAFGSTAGQLRAMLFGESANLGDPDFGYGMRAQKP